jgi:flagellar operon protein
MDIKNRPITSIQQIQNERFKSSKTNNAKSNLDTNFKDIFQQSVDKNSVKFSKHANLRLNTRNIDLTKDQIGRLEQGVINAEKKGIKESLVLIDNIALVVNVENKTVVTALDQKESKEHIFTNIDGAVVL